MILQLIANRNKTISYGTQSYWGPDIQESAYEGDQTYVLLESCAPNSYNSRNQTSCIHTDISNCANCNSYQHNHYAQLCVPGIMYMIKDNLQKT
jgi:hypothetical protein